MESTLKIDYSGRGVHGIPVIKIVQPLHLVESTNNEAIEDVRDRLIAEFLHTPCMVNRNYYFRLDTYGNPIPTGKATDKQITVSTISAIEEGQLFHTFKGAILDRLISYDDLVEINEIKNRPRKPGEKGTFGPVPHGWDIYHKVQEFFDWLWDQPYHTNFAPGMDLPVRKSPVKQKVIPMETIRDYFELALEQGERINAFQNTPEHRLDMKVSSAQEAFEKAFDIFGSKQGAEYWTKIINRIG